MNKMDKRVKRTKKILKDNLADLLLEKNLRNITVRELTEKADVSRGAFYTHYNDIYDLYEQMENDVFEDMGKIIDLDPTHSYGKVFKDLLDYVRDNASICKIFVSQGSESSFRDKMADMIEERIMEIVLYEMGATKSKVEWEYLVRYNCYGLIASLGLWIESNFAYPKDKLFRLIMDIDDKLDSIY